MLVMRSRNVNRKTHARTPRRVNDAWRSAYKKQTRKTLTRWYDRKIAIAAVAAFFSLFLPQQQKCWKFFTLSRFCRMQLFSILSLWQNKCKHTEWRVRKYFRATLLIRARFRVTISCIGNYRSKQRINMPQCCIVLSEKKNTIFFRKFERKN